MPANAGAAVDRPAPLPRYAIAAVLAGVLVQCVAFYAVRKDDAFITYRYAQNLVTGHGLSFNPGERVMGSTSPGHVLLAALAYPVVGQAALPSVMACLGCVGWSIQALAVFLLLRRALPDWGAGLCALAVLLGAGNSAPFVGLETNLVAGFLCCAFVCAVERRWLGAAAFTAAAALFRPDMYLAAALLALACLVELRTAAWRPALMFAALSAPWLIFAQSYFGSVIPQSAAAKYQRTDWLEYAVFEWSHPGSVTSPFPKSLLACGLAWVLAALGARVLVRRDRRLALVAVYPVLHYAAYSYLRPYKHDWHLYPATLIIGVLALAALAAFATRVTSRRMRALALLPLAILLVGYTARSTRFALDCRSDYWFGARDRAYREIASYLRAHARASDVVASVEVGTIGYYSGLTMYDWGALITPHPVQRPLAPRLSWTVVDKLFLEQFATGMTPVKRFASGDFFANVYSFDLMGEAVRRVVTARPAIDRAPPRAEVERELASLSRELDSSGLRIDAFLRARSGPPMR